MLFEVKHKRPNGKAISVSNLSEKDLYIGRTLIKAGGNSPVESKVMLRKSSYVDRLWRNGVIELGATINVPEKKEASDEASSLNEDSTPSVDSSQGKDTSSEKDEATPGDQTDSTEADVKDEETQPEPVKEEQEAPKAETPPEPVKEEVPTPVETETETPAEETPVKKPRGRKS